MYANHLYLAKMPWPMFSQVAQAWKLTPWKKAKIQWPKSHRKARHSHVIVRIWKNYYLIFFFFFFGTAVCGVWFIIIRQGMCYNKVNVSWETPTDNNENYLKKKIRWNKSVFCLVPCPWHQQSSVLAKRKTSTQAANSNSRPAGCGAYQMAKTDC